MAECSDRNGECFKRTHEDRRHELYQGNAREQPTR